MARRNLQLGKAQGASVPDFNSMSWDDLRVYAKSQGVKANARSRNDILSDLQGMQLRGELK